MPIIRRTDAEWMKERRRRVAYGEWRTLVEECGGTMKFDRGSKDWIINFGSQSKRIPTMGHHYRDLDLSYGKTPEKSSNPYDWDHYSGPFSAHDAISKLKNWFPKKENDFIFS
jgi:hypothetical protein